MEPRCARAMLLTIMHLVEQPGARRVMAVLMTVVLLEAMTRERLSRRS